MDEHLADLEAYGRLRAQAMVTTGRRPRTYSDGRVCARLDCGTRLSRYNAAKHCHRHTPIRFPRTRGKK